jgi:hypothetical protein
LTESTSNLDALASVLAEKSTALPSDLAIDYQNARTALYNIHDDLDSFADSILLAPLPADRPEFAADVAGVYALFVSALTGSTLNNIEKWITESKYSPGVDTRQGNCPFDAVEDQLLFDLAEALISDDMPQVGIAINQFQSSLNCVSVWHATYLGTALAEGYKRVIARLPASHQAPAERVLLGMYSNLMLLVRDQTLAVGKTPLSLFIQQSKSKMKELYAEPSSIGSAIGLWFTNRGNVRMFRAPSLCEHTDQDSECISASHAIDYLASARRAGLGNCRLSEAIIVPFDAQRGYFCYSEICEPSNLAITDLPISIGDFPADYDWTELHNEQEHLLLSMLPKDLSLLELAGTSKERTPLGIPVASLYIDRCDGFFATPHSNTNLPLLHGYQFHSQACLTSLLDFHGAPDYFGCVSDEMKEYEGDVLQSALRPREVFRNPGCGLMSSTSTTVIEMDPQHIEVNTKKTAPEPDPQPDPADPEPTAEDLDKFDLARTLARDEINDPLNRLGKEAIVEQVIPATSGRDFDPSWAKADFAIANAKLVYRATGVEIARRNGYELPNNGMGKGAFVITHPDGSSEIYVFVEALPAPGSDPAPLVRDILHEGMHVLLNSVVPFTIPPTTRPAWHHFIISEMGYLIIGDPQYRSTGPNGETRFDKGMLPKGQLCVEIDCMTCNGESFALNLKTCFDATTMWPYENTPDLLYDPSPLDEPTHSMWSCMRFLGNNDIDRESVVCGMIDCGMMSVGSGDGTICTCHDRSLTAVPLRSLCPYVNCAGMTDSEASVGSAMALGECGCNMEGMDDLSQMTTDPVLPGDPIGDLYSP